MTDRLDILGMPDGPDRRLTAALVEALEEDDALEEFARVGMERALAGDFDFWRFIAERAEAGGDDEDRGDR